MVEPTGLYETLWLEGIVFAVFFMFLIVCSFIIWWKKEKLSKVAYILELILTIILYFMNMSAIYDDYLEKGVFEITLSILGIVFILYSIFSHKRAYNSNENNDEYCNDNGGY